jgi:uncharacterized SAM-binding protein YcdF (DUF218 family)
MLSKKAIIISVFILSIATISVVSAPIYLKIVGKSLVYETQLKKADVIIVLSGGDGPRVQKGVELYKAGLGGKILMTGNPHFDRSMSEYMSEYAQRLGVPSKNILIEKESLSTFDNAIYSYKVLKNKNIQSIILVTSKFHTARSYKIFKKAFQNSNIEILVAGSEDNVDYNKWWKEHEMSEKVLIELGKTFIYNLKY